MGPWAILGIHLWRTTWGPAGYRRRARCRLLVRVNAWAQHTGKCDCLVAKIASFSASCLWNSSIASTQENLNLVGRVFSGASVLCCPPNAIASGQTVLATLATEEQLRKVVTAGGFTRFRRATQTPFNRVFEARP